MGFLWTSLLCAADLGVVAALTACMSVSVTLQTLDVVYRKAPWLNRSMVHTCASPADLSNAKRSAGHADGSCRQLRAAVCCVSWQRHWQAMCETYNVPCCGHCREKGSPWFDSPIVSTTQGVSVAHDRLLPVEGIAEQCCIYYWSPCCCYCCHCVLFL